MDVARTSQIRLIQPLQRGFLKRPEIQSRQVRTTEGTVGISATGHLDERTLRNLLQGLPEGTWELVCHPGYNDAELDTIPTRLRATRDIERKALLSVFGGSAGQRVGGSASQQVGGSAGQEVSGSAGQRFEHAPDEASHFHPHLPSLQLIHYGSLAVQP